LSGSPRHVASGNGRGGGTAVLKFYELRDNLELSAELLELARLQLLGTDPEERERRTGLVDRSAQCIEAVSDRSELGRRRAWRDLVAAEGLFDLRQKSRSEQVGYAEFLK
jgi:hypothetical protein